MQGKLGVSKDELIRCKWEEVINMEITRRWKTVWSS